MLGQIAVKRGILEQDRVGWLRTGLCFDDVRTLRRTNHVVDVTLFFIFFWPNELGTKMRHVAVIRAVGNVGVLVTGLQQVVIGPCENGIGVFVDDGRGRFFLVLPTKAEDQETGQHGYQEDDEEDDDQGDADAKGVSGAGGRDADRSTAAQVYLAVVNDVTEDGTCAVEGLDFTVDGEIGKAALEVLG